MKGVLIAIGVLVGVLVLGWLFQGNDFFMYRVFAPQYEAVRRETFEQSKSYRQGMVQELQNMQFEYERATPEQKIALRSIILHRSADIPADVLTPSLNTFLSQLRREP